MNLPFSLWQYFYIYQFSYYALNHLDIVFLFVALSSQLFVFFFFGIFCLRTNFTFLTGAFFTGAFLTGAFFLVGTDAHQLPALSLHVPVFLSRLDPFGHRLFFLIAGFTAGGIGDGGGGGVGVFDF